MSRFWPSSEPSQHDYERLRSAVVGNGRLPEDLAAARFTRRGLAGLITWPNGETAFSAAVVGALRAAWTPYGDPRRSALAATYRLLLEALHSESPVDDLMVSGGWR